MHLDETERIWKARKVADFAAASVRGTEEVQRLVAPILPVLYGFVARRSSDPDEAVEDVAETLLAARSRLGRSDSPQPLLGWLLRHADGVLRSHIDADPLLLAGLDPARGALPVRLRAALIEVLPRLRPPQLLALGMRFGDGLPLEVVAATLGVEPPAARALVSEAVARLVAAAYPDRAPARIDPARLDEYASMVLTAGRVPPGWEVPAELRTVLEGLAALRRPVPLSPADERAVWRLYEEQRQEFAPGRPPPGTPSWLPPSLAVALLLLLLAGASVWYLSARASDRTASLGAPQAGVAQPPAISTATLDRAGTVLPRPTPTTSAAGQRVLREVAGRLYYTEFLRGGLASRLVYSDLSDRRQRALPRVVLSSNGVVQYSVSPLNGQVVYSGGEGLFLWDGRARPPKARLLLMDRGEARGRANPRAGSPSPPVGTLNVGALAWHPRGRTIAFVDTPYTYPGPEYIYTYTPGLDARLGAPVANLPYGEHAYDLQWSPGGESLLASTGGGTLVVQLSSPRQHRPSPPPVYLGGRDARWSPRAGSRLLLWTSKPWPGTNGPFGIADPDGRNSRTLGTAAFAAWSPDGAYIVYGRYADGIRGAVRFWRLNLKTGETEGLARVTGLYALGRQVEFAPDGRHLAYSSVDGVWIADYVTGETAKLPGTDHLVTRLSWQRPGSASNVPCARRMAASCGP
jgi:DNA-directed RNA polymerase specialized sigma24 family protein